MLKTDVAVPKTTCNRKTVADGFYRINHIWISRPAGFLVGVDDSGLCGDWIYL